MVEVIMEKRYVHYCTQIYYKKLFCLNVRLKYNFCNFRCKLDIIILTIKLGKGGSAETSYKEYFK